MIFILILTGKCNLNCKYCGSIDESIMPPEISSYDIGKFVDLINSLNRVSIAFYSGELPLFV